MKKLFTIFLLFLLSLSIYANDKKVLGVFMNDGTMVCFSLNEKPVITFVDDAVKVVSTSQEALIKRSLVDHFEFLAEMPTDINDVEDESTVGGKIDLDGNTIHVSGLQQGSSVRIFSVSGELLTVSVVGNDGTVTISVDSLPRGIYLVNYNETTIKFMKR